MWYEEDVFFVAVLGWP